MQILIVLFSLHSIHIYIHVLLMLCLCLDTGLQDTLDAVLQLVIEDIVPLGGLLQRQAVSDHKGRIDCAYKSFLSSEADKHCSRPIMWIASTRQHSHGSK